MVSSLPKHLERMHKEESLVETMTSLPKGTVLFQYKLPFFDNTVLSHIILQRVFSNILNVLIFLLGSAERRKIIDGIRKEGNFLYNTEDLPEGENKILCRRPQKRNPRLDSHYKACPSCKGYVSKLTLRRHYHKCSNNKPMGIRDIMIRSKAMEGNISKNAVQTLKDEVFPIFRDSPAVDILRHDTLAIARGNMLCSKYRSKHLHTMIRSNLKLLGEFLLEIRQLDGTIKELQDVFSPTHFKKVVVVINTMGKLNEKTGVYGAPGTSRAMCTALKQCARNLISQCIMDGDVIKKKMVKDFYHLMVDECPSLINATITETILQRRRRKTIKVPSTSDVKALSDYCTKKKYSCWKE